MTHWCTYIPIMLEKLNQQSEGNCWCFSGLVQGLNNFLLKEFEKSFGQTNSEGSGMISDRLH